MAKQIIFDGESGLDVLNALNGNFTELYGALNFPIQDEGVAGNSQVVVPENTLIMGILVRPDSGSPVLSIGDSPGSGNMLGSQEVSDILPVQMFWPMLTGGNIYLTLAGGTVSISIIVIKNVF